MEITGDKRDVIKKTDLEFMYSAYCQKNELAELGKKNVALRLASLGIPKKNHHGIEVYTGVKVKDFIEVDDNYPPF